MKGIGIGPAGDRALSRMQGTKVTLAGRTGFLPLVDSVNRTSRNLCVLRDALKIISDRQKKDKEELLATVKQGIQMSANREDKGLADEIHKLKHDIMEQLSEPQHKKAVRTSFQVTHDLTTNTSISITVEGVPDVNLTGTPSWAGHQKDYGTTII